MLCALFAAICYGVASTMQAVAARSTRDDGAGVDPRLLFRLLGNWRYLSSLVLDVVGLVAQVTALRSLPLFLVQAAMAASIVVTALLAVRWFGLRLSRTEWASVAIVCAGLAMLGAAAESQGAGHGSHHFHYVLLVSALVLAALGLAAGRLPDPARTALLGLVSGMGFGTYMSLDLALMTEVLPKGSAAGKDLGLLNIATNVPQALGPIIASALITSFAVGADKTPGYRVLFGFAIAAVLISAVAVRPIKGVK